GSLSTILSACGSGAYRRLHSFPTRRSSDLDSQLAALAELNVLAPLHNPPALAVIAAVRARLGTLPVVGVFDTAYYAELPEAARQDRKSTRLNSSHSQISYAVLCLQN